MSSNSQILPAKEGASGVEIESPAASGMNHVDLAHEEKA